MENYNDKVKALLENDVIPEATINRNNVYEQLYTVNGRTIVYPSETANITGVEDDNRTETLRFRIPRFWDGNDLAQHIGKILFINAAGESDEYQIEDAKVNETSIVFQWCLDSRVTKKAGDVNFAIRFETINVDTSEIVFRWTTLPAKMKISEGLDWSDSQIEATYPTILEQWLQRMTDCEANVNDLLENAGSKITDVTEATEKANTAAKNAEDATIAANTATNNANAATIAAKSATDAANKAATDVNTVTNNANTSISETKDAAISDISAAKDAVVSAATNATNATKTANDAATAANTASSNAKSATTSANLAADKANLAADKVNNFKYLGYWKEGFDYKVNNLVRRMVDGVNHLYMCYVEHTSTAETDPATSSTRFLEILKDGEKGDTGEQGIQGIQGEKGENGERGLSAFEVAVENGFEGTVEEWLASLKGDKGDTPIIGVDYYTTEQQTALAEQIKELVLTDVDNTLDTINGEVI